MYEYEIKLSQNTSDKKTIGFASSTATVFADNETEAREIIADEEPEMTIEKITQIKD